MRNTLIALLALGAVSPATAQGVPVQNLSGAREASAKFTAALSAADAQKAASFLADDAVALPPGRAPLNGKADIQRFLGNMTRMAKDLRYTSEDFKGIDASTVREVGTFAFKMRDNDIEGKYLLIWTKVGPDWKVSADMWNRSGGGGNGRSRQGGRPGAANQGGRFQGGAHPGSANQGGANQGSGDQGIGGED